MFSDVPNPAILLRWFISPKLVKLWLNPGAEKTPLIWYFDLSNHIKAIFLFLFFVSAKTLLKEPKSQWWQWSPPLPFLFGQNIPCDVAQTSEDFIGPGIKIGWQPHPSHHWRSNEAIETLVLRDLRLDRRTFSLFYFSVLFYEVFGSSRWMSVRFTWLFI